MEARRSITASVAIFIILLTPCAVSGAGSERSDSALVTGWSVLYRNRIELSRVSEPFPWNEAEEVSHVSDRLALMAEFTPAGFLTVFMKGATGLGRGEEGFYRSKFHLEQGHIGLGFSGGTVGLRLFLREKVYRTDYRLLQLHSDYSPLLEGRGGGARLDVDGGTWYGLTCYETRLKNIGDEALNGGLPDFGGGGDIFRFFRVRLGGGDRLRAGVAFSQVRSTVFRDAVSVSTDLGFRLMGMELVAELSRSREGDWGDLSGSSLLDIRPRNFKLDGISAIFSENTAFSAELLGVELKAGSVGTLGFSPGYRFYGSGFLNQEGEIRGGLAETYLVSWWKPERYDALVSLEAVDGYRAHSVERYGVLEGMLRARFKGGFELREGFLLKRGGRPSVALSLHDESRIARIGMTARIDDTGEGNDFSFLADGCINIGTSWLLRSVLYLFDSRRSRYDIELQFMKGRRFLFRAAFGSFDPFHEDPLLERGLAPARPAQERRVAVFTRVWFGKL